MAASQFRLDYPMHQTDKICTDEISFGKYVYSVIPDYTDLMLSGKHFEHNIAVLTEFFSRLFQ